MIYELQIQIEELRAELGSLSMAVRAVRSMPSSRFPERNWPLRCRDGWPCRSRTAFLIRPVSTPIVVAKLLMFSCRAHFIDIGNDADRRARRSLVPAEFSRV
ncbi:hypothetical protein [Pararhizobium arenae]|uniref:hypothetical protein n=1 Tax=Pararhizobium arenae TaxID=1856850 RepID=UPI000A54CD46|nr:hypothetical protein [Pararhizobium arenae]